MASLDDVLAMIFSLLDCPKSYLRAGAVCKRWRAVAKEPQVRKAAFMHHWRLLCVHGRPRQLSFYETATQSSFARWHQVQRFDTLQMLAVKYGLDLPTLKRTNNLMTDHSIHSRTHLFVPVKSRQELMGKRISFCFCPLAKREFAVVDCPYLNRPQLQQQEQEQQHRVSTEPPQHQGHGPREEWSSDFKIDALQAKLCVLLGRSLHVDESTAKFYLEDAGGDVKAAMEAFAQDLAWEGTTPGPIRKVPLQRWISGEIGI